MRMTLVGSLAVSWLLATGPMLPQEGAPPSRPADALYPCKTTESIVRFYSVGKEQPDLEKAGAALGALGASIVYGPCVSPKRQGACFLAVRAPASLPDTDLAKELRKVGGAVRELFCAAFEGHTPPMGMDAETRDEVLGMFRPVAWIDYAGAWTQFYLEKAPSAEAAVEMSERYEMLWEHAMKLGRPARESFTWKLDSVPDAAVAERLLKAARKLDGVLQAALLGSELTIVVELSGLKGSGDGGTLTGADKAFVPIDAAGRVAPRATWCTQPLFEVLAQEELVAGAVAGAGR